MSSGKWSKCPWTKRVYSLKNSALTSPRRSTCQSSHRWPGLSPFLLKMASIYRATTLLLPLSGLQRGDIPWALPSKAWPNADAAPTVTANQSLGFQVTSCWVETFLTRWTSTRSWTKTSTSKTMLNWAGVFMKYHFIYCFKAISYFFLLLWVIYYSSLFKLIQIKSSRKATWKQMKKRKIDMN